MRSLFVSLAVIAALLFSCYGVFLSATSMYSGVPMNQTDCLNTALLLFISSAIGYKNTPAPQKPVKETPAGIE